MMVSTSALAAMVMTSRANRSSYESNEYAFAAESTIDNKMTMYTDDVYGQSEIQYLVSDGFVAAFSRRNRRFGRSVRISTSHRVRAEKRKPERREHFFSGHSSRGGFCENGKFWIGA